VTQTQREQDAGGIKPDFFLHTAKSPLPRIKKNDGIQKIKGVSGSGKRKVRMPETRSEGGKKK